MRAALLLLLVVPAIALAQAGRFLLAAGEVTLVRGAQELRAVAGTAVQPGDTIRVGARSNAQIRMSDQSIISLRSSTVFRIDEYVYRGDETDRSIFSLVKGGMRTVGGAIARQQTDALVRTAARSEPSGPQPAAEERKPRDESERKVVDLVRAPLRTIAGALTPTRHAVRVPTAMIGVRGTHYTLVHCDNDCVETRRTSVAALFLAQSDAGAPFVGNLAPNGTYGGISDGLIGVVNNRDDQEFGANSFFYVASADSLIQSLIGPPTFLYDRLEAQERNRGLPSAESSATMARSGLNAESRPSETPIPPAPPTFVVTERRTDSGFPVVVVGDPENPITTPLPPLPPVVPPLPPVAPSTAFLSAFTNATGGPDTVGAFVDTGAVSRTDIGDGIVWLSAFNVPAGSTVNPATGAYSGSGIVVQDQTFPNALNAYWGVWFDGSVTDATGKTTIATGTPLFHYLVGPNTPPEIVAAKRGSFSFDLVPGTLNITNNLGEAPLSVTGTRGLIVDFTVPSVTFPATDITFATQPWKFPGNTTPIVIQAGGGAFISDSVTGSCGPITSCQGTAVLSRTGAFMGPVGDHLGVALQGRTLSGTPASLQGTAIFSCSQPPC